MIRRIVRALHRAWKFYLECCMPEDVGHGVKCTEGENGKTCIECLEIRAELHRR